MITLEEERLSELLKRTVPEPPIELSADRVTILHVDRSRWPWLMPALAAASVVAVAGATVGLSAVHRSSAAGSSAASAAGRAQTTVSASAGPSTLTAGATPSAAQTVTAAPAVAPKAFNPLTLPANFGWLPSGFTENGAVGSFAMAAGPLEVSTTAESLGATAPGGEGLQLTVAANGVKPSPWIGGGTGGSSELKVIGTAPDVDGHPAKWLAGGLEWQYATGGSAILLTGGSTAAQALAGWGQSCQANRPKGSTSGVVTPGMVSCASIPPQTSALQAELMKVASNLSWTPTPFTFPYKFTQALPQGWTPGSDAGAFVDGVLTSSELDLYSAVLNVTHALGDNSETLAITGGVDPSMEASNCQDLPGYSAAHNGVQWMIAMGQQGIGPDYIPTWTSSATACPDPMGVHGMTGVSITTDAAADDQVGQAGLNALLPIIKFIPNQANWVTDPLAS